jgi:hypothetical protein
MRKRTGPLAEISVEFAEIIAIGSGMKNFPYEYDSSLTGMKSNKSCRLIEHFLLSFVFVL